MSFGWRLCSTPNTLQWTGEWTGECWGLSSRERLSQPWLVSEFPESEGIGGRSLMSEPSRVGEEVARVLVAMQDMGNPD